MSLSLMRDFACRLPVAAVASTAFLFGLLPHANASPLHPHRPRHSHSRYLKHHPHWRWHHIRRAHEAQSNWYSSEGEKAQSRSGFAFTGSSSVSTGSGLSSAASSGILAEAKRYIGEGNPTGLHKRWCKAFVNMVLRKTGHAVDRSARAIDGLHLGYRVSNPQPGDIAVMPHHITFFAGWGGRGFYGIGGNQGRSVRMSNFSTSQVIAFIHPS